MFSLSSPLCVAIFLAVSAGSASAQCGEWRTGFDQPGGVDGIVEALAVYDDGQGPALYVAGYFPSAGSVPVSNVARWDGASWSPLGLGVDGRVHALTVWDDGTGSALYAAGVFTHAGGAPANLIARWDGMSWSPLGGGLTPASGQFFGAFSMAVHEDAKGSALFVAGLFSQAGSTPANRIARWDGTSWSDVTGLSYTGSAVPLALAVFDDGTGAALHVGGRSGTWPNVGGFLHRWTGTVGIALPGMTGGSGELRELYVFDDGAGAALYGGGSFTSAGGSPAQNVARWDGASWAALGGGVSGLVRCFGGYDDGTGPALYVGGDFASAGGIPAASVARWDGIGWSPLASGLTQGPLQGGPEALHVFDGGNGPALFAGGTFIAAGGATANNIAAWENGSWSPLAGLAAQGFDLAVQSLAAWDDGSGEALYAGGSFLHAGATSVERIAKWNGASWSSLGSGLDDLVVTLAVFDDGQGSALYAGGWFQNAGGAPARGLAKWDGAAWSALGMEDDVYALAVFDDGQGPALYAGGAFLQLGGVAVDHVARWDGTMWTSLGAGMDQDVHELAVLDDGTGPALYAAGTFTTAGGVPASRVARWDGTSWSDLGGGVDAAASALVVFDDGSGPAIYLGGAFSSAGGVPAERIARWDGTAWSAVGGGTNHSVRDLAVFDDGTGSALYAVGQFTSAGGTDASAIARWNGSTWSPLHTGLSGGPAATLFVFDHPTDGPDLWVGGSFTAAGGAGSSRIAVWNGCSGPGTAFCFGDGSAGACPCSNAGAAGNGCENSSGSGGARLDASGTTQPDTLVLTSSGELPNALSIFLQGSQALGAPVAFGDGLRCVGGSLKRLYVENAVGGVATAPLAGDPSVSAQSANLGDPIAPGSTRWYQVYYRDPDLGFCPAPPGNSWNVSSGVAVLW